MTEATARRLVRDRAAGRCEAGSGRAGTNFAHRRARSQGGEWRASNGLWLSGSGTTGAHGWATAHPALAAGAGWRLTFGQDPLETPAWIAHSVFGLGWWYLDDEGGLTAGPELPAPVGLPNPAGLA